MECLPCGGGGWWDYRGGISVVNSAELCSHCVCFPPLYLSVGALLHRGLHHHVTLHSHLQLRDEGGNAAVARWPQRAQELSSPDCVHNYSPVLEKRQQKFH